MNALRPPRPQSPAITGPAGRIEALLEEPEGQRPACFGVVCHPHPLHGGTLHNKVVHTLARALHDFSVPTVRFNYRGVGASEGHYADGIGETDDAVAVIEWGRQRWPGAVPWLLGFSFGGAVAIRAAIRAGAGLLVTVAPAIGRMAMDDEPAAEGDSARVTAAPWSGPAAAPRSGPAAAPWSAPAAAPRSGPAAAPRSGPAAAPRSGPAAAPWSGPAAAPWSGPACPWLVIQGDADDVIDARSVLEWASRQAEERAAASLPPLVVRVLRGAGHFFHGRLPSLREAVASFIRESGSSLEEGGSEVKESGAQPVG